MTISKEKKKEKANLMKHLKAREVPPSVRLGEPHHRVLALAELLERAARYTEGVHCDKLSALQILCQATIYSEPRAQIHALQN